MKLSTIRERMLSRIVSSTFVVIFARNSSAVLQIHPDLAFVRKDAVTSLKTNVETTGVL